VFSLARIAVCSNDDRSCDCLRHSIDLAVDTLLHRYTVGNMVFENSASAEDEAAASPSGIAR
jgi:hypothetical protein